MKKTMKKLRSTICEPKPRLLAQVAIWLTKVGELK
jgi:hypothetical protein